MAIGTKEVALHGVTALASAGAALGLMHLMALSPDMFDLFTDRHTDNLLRFVEKNPLTAFTSAIVVSPVAEEIVFRLAPLMALTAMGKAQGAPALVTALGSSLAFSLWHDLNPWTGVMNWHHIGTENIGHFAMGLAFWNINKRAGFSHAVTAHASMNGAVFAAAAQMY